MGSSDFGVWLTVTLIVLEGICLTQLHVLPHFSRANKLRWRKIVYRNFRVQFKQNKEKKTNLKNTSFSFIEINFAKFQRLLPLFQLIIRWCFYLRRWVQWSRRGRGFWRQSLRCLRNIAGGVYRLAAIVVFIFGFYGLIFWAKGWSTTQGKFWQFCSLRFWGK